MAKSFNHGISVIDASSEPRFFETVNTTSIGAVVTAPDADTALFPLNEPVAIFTHEVDKVAKLGQTGTALDVVNAVKAQGIEGRIVFVRVEEGSTAEDTRKNLIGSAASMSGVHALSYARGHTGCEPGILIAPGWGSGRIDNAKNPVADALEQVAKKLMAIAVFDTGGPTAEESIKYRSDFSSRYTYLIDPFVRVASGSDIAVKPASPFAAAMFLKRDKAKGNVYTSPSNQEVGGILGTARPITYFDGETDHEANLLNENGIATFIPSRIVQQADGQFSSNGRVLWGNRTTSDDPLWTFVNVVRTRSSIIKTIIDSFRPWANDENITSQHVIAVMRSLQEYLDSIVAGGGALGARVWFDRDLNQNESLRLGKLRVEFDAEESPPLEDLTFGSRRNEDYFDVLARDIQQRMPYQIGGTVADFIKAGRI